MPPKRWLRRGEPRKGLGLRRVPPSADPPPSLRKGRRLFRAGSSPASPPQQRGRGLGGWHSAPLALPWHKPALLFGPCPSPIPCPSRGGAGPRRGGRQLPAAAALRGRHRGQEGTLPFLPVCSSSAHLLRRGRFSVSQRCRDQYASLSPLSPSLPALATSAPHPHRGAGCLVVAEEEAKPETGRGERTGEILLWSLG